MEKIIPVTFILLWALFLVLIRFPINKKERKRMYNLMCYGEELPYESNKKENTEDKKPTDLGGKHVVDMEQYKQPTLKEQHAELKKQAEGPAKICEGKIKEAITDFCETTGFNVIKIDINRTEFFVEESDVLAGSSTDIKIKYE